MIKLFGRYLRSKAGTVLLFVFFAAVLAFSFSLYHLPAEAVLYPAALWDWQRWSSVLSIPCICIN